ncbi:hypothetical protein BS47DRAFT_1379304 [Hydnum rufescens UP504]|uniref:Uncharacterized protein n=1 Tax=Hydnum rufescens UP504 TaxID=1448309 RepID=A0A9P6B8M8_9AGAM|nr:hypothetical protein BS47DRAFT_1379304 [Hydnum rufescens UP504]
MEVSPPPKRKTLHSEDEPLPKPPPPKRPKKPASTIGGLTIIPTRRVLPTRRRTSESIGKSGGIIVPHPNVEPSQYHRHISVEVPPAQRMRQLLVWSSSRAQNASSPTSLATLPIVAPDMKLRLKNIQDDVIRMLAEGQVHTNPSSGDKAEGKASGHKVLMPNPTNVKNQERLSRWGANIERARVEEAIWNEFTKRATDGLVKSRAPQRHSVELADWKSYLDERWKLSAMMAEAAITTPGAEEVQGQMLSHDTERQVDGLHGTVNSLSEITQRVDAYLARTFKTISAHLGARGARTWGRSSILASLWSTGVGTSLLADSPFPSLRALSRLEPVAGTQPSQAAIRAFEEAKLERKITAVPPTPSKTPKRGSTPGRKR